uniref:CetH n=1 Tax=Actinomyces sp. Lu 9419 TaxID=416175 RepID=B5SP80_9ACTO|nr:CetH [Actinomyces sp. Lu 9419]
MSMTRDLDTRSVAERDRKHVWHPWSPVTDAGPGHPVIVSGRGYRVRDQDGVEYLDATAGAMNASCGFAHPALLGAVSEQMARLPHVDLSNNTHPQAGAVAERLAGLLPTGLDRTLLLNSGSEATEAAVRIVQDHWTHVGRRRDRIITLTAGYHGSTLVAQHLSGMASNRIYGAAPFPVTRVDLPLTGAALRTAEGRDALGQAFAEAIADGDPPAAVFLEPLLNVGGGIVLPAGFLSRLRALCDDSGALLVVDEVFCGFGRTGRMFGFEHDGVAPDVVTTSKGLSGGYVPFAAVTTTDAVFRGFATDPILGGLRYGHTTGGHAVACAVALAVLDTIEGEGLVESARVLGAELLARLEPLAAQAEVADVRGLGLVVTVQAHEEAFAAGVVGRLRADGVLVRRQGTAIMAIPPLIIDRTGIEELARAVERSVAAA